MATILYLDDDKIQHLLMKKMVKIHLPEVKLEIFGKVQDLLDWLKDHPGDLILSDLNLEEGSAWDFIPQFSASTTVPILLISGHVSELDKQMALGFSSVKGLLEKPISEEGWRQISLLLNL